MALPSRSIGSLWDIALTVFVPPFGPLDPLSCTAICGQKMKCTMALKPTGIRAVTNGTASLEMPQSEVYASPHFPLPCPLNLGSRIFWEIIVARSNLHL